MCRDVGLLEGGDEVEREWSEGGGGGWPRLSLGETVERVAVLRRPFSLAGRWDVGGGAVEVEIIHRVVGAGTAWLAKAAMGSVVEVLGPLGNGFDVGEVSGVEGEKEVVLLVGGGVGIPPMIYMAQALCRPRVVAFCGAVTRELVSLTVTGDAPPPKGPGSVEPLYNLAEFSRYGIPGVISTDDGSYGFKGYVTDALEAYLERYFGDTWEVGSKRPVVYTCGPEVMMKRVGEIALKRGLKCYAAVERAMACGMGTCQSCCIRVKDESKVDGWRYALACTEGPVFETRKLLW
jgi:dihydroorotate dehydrogenase electron transfer subunit